MIESGEADYELGSDSGLTGPTRPELQAGA
jgi:hypothetical protein